LAAGWLSQFLGWRITFIVLGAPGIGLAAMAWFTLKEPRLTERSGGAVPQSSRMPNAKETLTTLFANSTFRHLLFYFSIVAFFTYGIQLWQPAFFIRSYGLKTGELGTWLAAIYGVGTALGTYCGGILASRYAPNNERLQLSAAGIVYSSFGVVSVLVYLTRDYHLGFALMALGVLASSAAAGPVFATIQTIVPERMRALSISVLFLFANLIGMGLGPLAAGGLSDAFRPRFGDDSLRYALLILSPGYLWGGWHIWRASTTVTRDLQMASLAQRVVGQLPS